jgi:hypothetical protein
MIVLWLGFLWLIVFLEKNAKSELEKSFGGLLTCASVDIQTLNGTVIFKDLTFSSPLENTPEAPLCTVDELILNNLWSGSFVASEAVEFTTRRATLNIVKTADGRLNLGEFDRFMLKLEEEKDIAEKKKKDDKKDDEPDEDELFTVGSWVLEDVKINFWRQLEGGTTWSTVTLSLDRLALQNLTNDPANLNPTGLQLGGLSFTINGKTLSADSPTTPTAPLLQLPALQATLQLARTENDPTHVESLRVFQPRVELNGAQKPYSTEELERFFDGFFEEPEEFASKDDESDEKNEDSAKKDPQNKGEPRFTDAELQGGVLVLNGLETPVQFSNLNGKINWLPKGKKELTFTGALPNNPNAFSLQINGEHSLWQDENGLLQAEAKFNQFPLAEFLKAINAQPKDPDAPRLEDGTLTANLNINLNPKKAEGTLVLEMTSIKLSPDNRSLLKRFQPAGAGSLVRGLLPTPTATAISPVQISVTTEWETPSLLLLYTTMEQALREKIHSAIPAPLQKP